MLFLICSYSRSKLHAKYMDVENVKVSILVPVYGVERFIGRCAKSLFDQSYSNIEFLFVDDCSPDRSIELLEETLKNYPPIAK